MGEANYTLTADFPTAEAAAAGATKLSAFLKEVDKAYNFWQASRGTFHDGLSPGDFWAMFEFDYPDLFEWLNRHGKVNRDDCNNSLAGVFSWTNGDKPAVSIRGTVVQYGEEVWHFADWSLLALWCKTIGATKAYAMSDEGYSYETP